MFQPLISVIVPIYNVEQYLESCIESAVNQTYKNLEIILVDDGSPDNCPKICDYWAERDTRIKVIHKQNGGLSDARNAALDICEGEYIFFLDSDDTIVSNALEILYGAIVKDNTKLALGGIKKISEYGEDDKLPPFKGKISADNCLTLLYEYGGNFVMACNKLYHKSLWANKRFKYGIVFEDAEVTYRFYIELDFVSVVGTATYHYFIRDNSLSHISFNPSQLSIIDTMKEQLDLFEQYHYQEAYKRVLIVFLRRVKAAYINISLSMSNDNINKNQYRGISARYYIKGLKLGGRLGFKQAIKELMFFFLPHLFIQLFKEKEASLV